MVERFNGRIANILRTHHFQSGEELEAMIMRYIWLYNHHLQQKALGHVSPIQAMKQWEQNAPTCSTKGLSISRDMSHAASLYFAERKFCAIGFTMLLVLTVPLMLIIRSASLGIQTPEILKTSVPWIIHDRHE